MLIDNTKLEKLKKEYGETVYDKVYNECQKNGKWSELEKKMNNSDSTALSEFRDLLQKASKKTKISSNNNQHDYGSEDLNNEFEEEPLEDLWSHVEGEHFEKLKEKKKEELKNKIIDSAKAFANGSTDVEEALKEKLKNLVKDEKIDENDYKNIKELINFTINELKEELRQLPGSKQKNKKIKERQIKALLKEKEEKEKEIESSKQYLKGKGINIEDDLEEIYKIKEQLVELEEKKKKKVEEWFKFDDDEGEKDTKLDGNNKLKVEHIKSTLEYILSMDKGNRKVKSDLGKLGKLEEKEELKKKLEEKEEEIRKLREDLSRAESDRDSLREKLEQKKHQGEIDKRDAEIESLRKEKEEQRKRAERAEKISENYSIHNPTTILQQVQNQNQTASASSEVNVSNVIAIQYDKNLEEKEKKELEEDYQELEESDEKLPANQQELKRVILYLGAKKVFSDTRKSTIENLVNIYKNSDKIDKKYNRVTEFTSYLDAIGDIVNSIYPPAGVAIKLVAEGVPIINDLLKKYSLTGQDKKFGDYLREDEKSLILLQKTVNSLQSDQNTPLFELLSSSQGLLEKNSIFVISEEESKIDLRKSGGLGIEDMEKVIESLNKHLKRFVEEFKEKAGKYDEKIKEFLADNNSLQTELSELLIKLSIGIEENNLQGLIEDAKKKLKVRKLMSLVKDKNKKRSLDLLFEELFSDPISQEEFIKRLEEVEKNYPKKIEEEISNIYKIKDKLSKLESELKSLQNQQAQIEQRSN